MTTEADIRAALDRLATRAPDPGRVRAGLAGRARARRQRRLILAAGGTVAVAGTLGPALLLGRHERTADPDVRPAPNLGPVAPEPAPSGGNVRVPMLYRPTWLPDGYVEEDRVAAARGGVPDYQWRRWVRHMPPGTVTYWFSTIELMLFPTRWPLVFRGAAPAKIHGVDGRVVLSNDYRTTTVVWPVTGELSLAVIVEHAGVDHRDVALRVARSVAVDGVAGVESPLDFGWLPAGLPAWREVSLYPGGEGWWATLSVVDDGQLESSNRVDRMPIIIVQLTSAARMPSGRRATIRGRPGVVNSYGASGGGYAAVRLDGGLTLHAERVSDTSSPLEDLLRVVEELRIGPPPYRGWFERR